MSGYFQSREYPECKRVCGPQRGAVEAAPLKSEGLVPEKRRLVEGKAKEHYRPSDALQA
jgi:hypothetical protein